MAAFGAQSSKLHSSACRPPLSATPVGITPAGPKRATARETKSTSGSPTAADASITLGSSVAGKLDKKSASRQARAATLSAIKRAALSPATTTLGRSGRSLAGIERPYTPSSRKTSRPRAELAFRTFQKTPVSATPSLSESIAGASTAAHELPPGPPENVGRKLAFFGVPPLVKP